MVQVNPNNQSDEGTIWFDYFSVTGAPPPPKKTNIGAVVGGVVGGITILILLVLLLLFYRRRKRLSKDIPVEPCESATRPPVLSLSYLLQFQLTPTMSCETQNTMPWHPPTSPSPRLPLCRKLQKAVVARMVPLHPLQSLCSTGIVAYEMLILYLFFQIMKSNFPPYTAQFKL